MAAALKTSSKICQFEKNRVKFQIFKVEILCVQTSDKLQQTLNIVDLFFFQMPTRLIWFSLIEASTGKVCKVSSVSMQCNHYVDQFRKAVKQEFANKLSSLDAADLLVYKNEASFLEGKDEPLDPT